MTAVKSAEMASHGLVHSRIGDNFIVVYADWGSISHEDLHHSRVSSMKLSNATRTAFRIDCADNVRPSGNLSRRHLRSLALPIYWTKVQ